MHELKIAEKGINRNRRKIEMWETSKLETIMNSFEEGLILIYVHIANFVSHAFFLGGPWGLWFRNGEVGEYEEEE